LNKLLTYFFLFLGISTFASPWFQKSIFPAEARHRTTSFSIGNQGYMGLGHINSGTDVVHEDFWKYDPSSNSWSQVANYPEGKIYHATCFVIDNLAYVGTGRRENGSYSAKFHAYNSQTNTWTTKSDFIGPPRRGSVGFSLNNIGYVGTGQISGGFSSAFYKYEPTSDSWAQIASIPATERTSAVGFSINNLGYVGTGETPFGPINDFWEYSPLTEQWIQKANVSNKSRQEAFGFSINSSGYIGTGLDSTGTNNLKDMWQYFPASNTWLQCQDFDGTARRYISGFTIGSRAYMGLGTNGTNFNDFWMFDPALSDLIEILSKLKIEIYPNPATHYLRFELSKIPTGALPKKLKIVIRDLQGNKKIDKLFDEYSKVFDISELPPSTYFYSFEYEQKRLRTGKFIIIK